MTRIEFTTEVAAPVERLWEFYSDISNLPRITPPSTRVTLPNPLPRLEPGVRFMLKVRIAPLLPTIEWETVFTACREPFFFIDEQGSRGPFAIWRQEHLFERISENRTLLRDSITYELGYGPFGSLGDLFVVRPLLRSMFAYRHKMTRLALE